MAQSEAGKSVKTVPNEEEEEEFGPQLITKLEVCIQFDLIFIWIKWKTISYSLLQVNGISTGDIKRLQAEGYHTIDSLMFVPKKALL